MKTSEFTANDILARVHDGQRITEEEANRLFAEADLVPLGAAADAVRARLHPDRITTYIIDRNINYSNVCAIDCYFCAFYRKTSDKDTYVLTHEQIGEKIAETIALCGRQILMQGGLHPKLKLGWYEDLLRFIKTNYGIHIHAFSAPEIVFFAKINKLPLRTVIERLREAGLDSIPGGGAEILVDEVRDKISRYKCTTAEWLEVMRTAHGIGMRTTATMMFGHKETFADRVRHFEVVRQLQDETGGFTAFIPWTFQPENTQMPMTPVGSHDYLRTLAISRIYLDNFDNIQGSWVTQGPKIGGMSLHFGANDLGSTMIEENVVAAAGCAFRMDAQKLEECIASSGFTPRRRNYYYQYIT